MATISEREWFFSLRKEIRGQDSTGRADETRVPHPALHNGSSVGGARLQKIVTVYVQGQWHEICLSNSVWEFPGFLPFSSKSYNLCWAMEGGIPCSQGLTEAISHECVINKYDGGCRPPCCFNGHHCWALFCKLGREGGPSKAWDWISFSAQLFYYFIKALVKWKWRLPN